MTPWLWHVGHQDSVEQDDLYDIAECKTREDAIHTGLRETVRGEKFYIVEARSSTAEKHEGSDRVPFLRTRNEELITNGVAS